MDRSAPANENGRSQTDGPAEAKDGEDTEANKALVRDFYETVLVRRDHAELPRFFADGHFIQHDPESGDGVAALTRQLDAAVGAGRALTVAEVRFVLGQGDFVIAAAKGALGDEPHVFFDLYRIEDGAIAEHWGVTQKVPPREDWRNANGML